MVSAWYCRLVGRGPLVSLRCLATGEELPKVLIDVLDRLTERESASRSAIALAFVLVHPSAPVTVIGIQKTQRLIDANVSLRFLLDRQDVCAILQASEGAPLP